MECRHDGDDCGIVYTLSVSKHEMEINIIHPLEILAVWLENDLREMSADTSTIIRAFMVLKLRKEKRQEVIVNCCRDTKSSVKR